MIVILIGAGLRTYNLSHVITWYDEALTLVHLSGQYDGIYDPTFWSVFKEPVTFKSMLDVFQNRSCSDADVLRSVIRTHPEHAAGFYLALHQWKNIVKSDVTLLRLAPILFGVLVLPAFYWFSSELLRSKATSLLCTLVLALSPLQIVQSQELREYSLYELCFVLSSASFLYAWRKNTAFSWILYGCLSIVGYQCSFWMLVVVGTQLIFSTLAIILRGRNKHRPFRPYLNKWIAHITITALALLAVSGQISERILRREHALQMVVWVKTPMTDMHKLVDAWLFSRLSDWMYIPDPQFLSRYELVLLPILLIELWAVIYMARRERPQFAFLAIIVLTYASILDLQDAIHGGRRSFVLRYFLPSIIVAVIPVCYMVCQFWRSRIPSRRILAVAIIGFLSVCQLWSDYSLQSCREHSIFYDYMTPVANFLNKRENVLVIADSDQINLCLMLSTAYLLKNPSRPFFWIFDKVPDWFTKNVDKACLIYAPPGVEKRYTDAGFKAVRYSRSIVMLKSRTVHTPFYREDKQKLQRLILKKERKLRSRPYWVVVFDRWMGR